MKKILLSLLASFYFCASVMSQNGLNNDQFYELKAHHSGLSISFSTGGDHLTQNKYIPGDSRFEFRFIPHPVHYGYFWIETNENPVAYLEVDTNTQPPTIKKSATKKDEITQFFYVKNLIDDYYYPDADFTIYSGWSPNGVLNQVFNVNGASTQEGESIILWPVSSEDNEKFTIRKRTELGWNNLKKVINSCEIKMWNSFPRGTIFFLEDSPNSVPVYTKQFFQEPSFISNISVKDLLDKQAKEYIYIEDIGGCGQTFYEVYLDSVYVGNPIKLRSNEIWDLEKLINKLVFDKAIQRSDNLHLLTVRNLDGHFAFYMPFYISQQKVITSILGSTTTPLLPHLVLHSPPGSQSYSFLEKGKNHCHGIELSVAKDKVNNIYGSIRLGVKGTLGFIAETEYEAYGELSASSSVGIRMSKTGSQEVCIQTTEEFQTVKSNLEGSGDVYIGLAHGLDYGMETQLESDYYSNRVRYIEGKSSLVFAPSTSIPSTKFIYTESYIENKLIPYLKNIINNPNSSPQEIDKANEQLHVWEQSIDLNRQNVAESTPITSINFSSGSTFKETRTISTSKSNSLEMNLTIEKEVGLEVGASIGGSGVNGGSKVNVKSDIGKINTNSTQFDNTTGYELSDSDVNDDFFIDIKRDQVYGTPVFVLDQIKSASSCPFEGGYQIDQPKLEIAAGSNGANFSNIATVSNVNINSPALFRLKLQNNSKYPRTYRLIVNANTNPDGAVIKVGGTTITGSNNYIDYSIEKSVSLSPILIDVDRGADQSIKHYGPIELILYSECESSIESKIFLNVDFLTATSEVDINSDHLKVSPNPNNGSFYVFIDGLYKNGKLELLDINGKIVFTQDIQRVNEYFKFNMTLQPAGLYILRVINNDHQINKKIVVQK